MTGCLSLTFITDYGLPELFLVSAVSSVLHGSTEPTIVLLLSENVPQLVISLVLIPASVLGASVGYLFGLYGIRRIIPFHNPGRGKRVQVWFGRYGAALLIFSPWIPFASDLVSIVAGIEDLTLPLLSSSRLWPRLSKAASRIFSLSSFSWLACTLNACGHRQFDHAQGWHLASRQEGKKSVTPYGT